MEPVKTPKAHSSATVIWAIQAKKEKQAVQTSMNVKLERTTATDTLYVPTQQEASNVAVAPGGLEMALSALTWTNAPMEPTCAANMQTARTPWAPTAASARRGTRAMASPVQILMSALRI